jgi:hypothetical protein
MLHWTESHFCLPLACLWQLHITRDWKMICNVSKSNIFLNINLYLVPIKKSEHCHYYQFVNYLQVPYTNYLTIQWQKLLQLFFLCSALHCASFVVPCSCKNCNKYVYCEKRQKEYVFMFSLQTLWKGVNVWSIWVFARLYSHIKLSLTLIRYSAVEWSTHRSLWRGFFLTPVSCMIITVTCM